MINHFVKSPEYKFDWIDVTLPNPEELDVIAKQYKLHPALVKDCLQPDHLPKYEEMENYCFFIFRMHTEKDILEADTVQELTSKIAVFYSEKFIITIHRKERDFFGYLKEMVSQSKLDTSRKLLNALVYFALGTYEEPGQKLAKTLDYYEQTVFLRNKKVPLLKGLYYLKRKAELIRNMLSLSQEIIDNIDTADAGNVNTRNTRDTYVRLKIIFDSLSENINHLLNIYFSASSQRTNEIVRVLTVFSVFFMPLTFIAGIYGMNFEYMPELTWKLGYPGSIGLMILVTAVIYFWFRRKGWL